VNDKPAAPDLPSGSFEGDGERLPVPRVRDTSRDVAAAACAVQALSLVGFVVFYLVELAQGAGDDPTRVVMSALLILVFAVGMGALARGWWRGANWPNTPTIVWGLLLLPVAWSLFQADRAVVALLVGLVAVVGIVAAVMADTSEKRVNPE
jgi:inner membrane protein involved in colicin E2 resistance